MSDYISRKAAVDAFFPVDPENDGSDGATPIYPEQNYSNNEIESILCEVPAADVEPVRHGRWVRTDDDWNSLTTFQCTVCGEEFCFEIDEDFELLNYNYCPNCGAKMDLEDETDG